jgi:hypothetical protein
MPGYTRNLAKLLPHFSGRENAVRPGLHNPGCKRRIHPDSLNGHPWMEVLRILPSLFDPASTRCVAFPQQRQKRRLVEYLNNYEYGIAIRTRTEQIPRNPCSFSSRSCTRRTCAGTRAQNRKPTDQMQAADAIAVYRSQPGPTEGCARRCCRYLGLFLALFVQ